jgi:hypothetical protein
MKIDIIRGKEFNIRVIKGQKKYDIFKIKFNKKDGTIFIIFPYFKYKNGILAELKHPANRKLPHKLNLEDYGKTTSHSVKYTHHTDGNVNFSQSGDIKTFKKKNRRSTPLYMDIGHLFTIILNDLSAFNDSENKSNKQYIDFNINKSFKDLKIIGEWRKIPYYNFFDERNVSFDSEYTIGQLYNMPFHNHALTIDIKFDSLKHRNKKGMLLFLGGFDLKIIIKNYNIDSYFLAFLYPARKFEEIKKLIGSQDYVESDYLG